MGIKLLQALRMMVRHLQLHRGLTTAFLGGDTSLKENIAYTVDSVSAAVVSIVGIDELLCENENWQGVTRHWARLSAGTQDLHIYENYQQHCKLIASCLELMLCVSYQYRLKPQFQLTGRLYWYELLYIGEKLGQLRALGVLRLTVMKDIKLLKRCQKEGSSCVKELDVFFNNKLWQGKVGREHFDFINNFIALADQYIIAPHSLFTSEQYFSRATDTIEIIYKNFDVEMQAMLHSYH